MLVRRLLAPLGGVAAAIALYPGTWGLDAIAREGQLGPGFWPRLAITGLALACVGKMLEDWQRLRRAALGAPDARPPLARGKLVAGIAFIVGYVLLAPVLGFALVSALFIAAFLILGGMRSVPAIATNVVVGVVALLYLFVKLVYLPLPKGDGPFEAVTLALYRALHLY